MHYIILKMNVDDVVQENEWTETYVSVYSIYLRDNCHSNNNLDIGKSYNWQGLLYFHYHLAPPIKSI